MIKYNFKNAELLREALTHSSCSIKSETGKKFNNERLEFIGDAVLSIVIAETLYRKLPYADEGVLSKLRSQIVCQDSVARIARNNNLNEMIITRCEGCDHIRLADAPLSDAMEAVIGAVYLDGGFDKASKFIKKEFEILIDKACDGDLIINTKSELQEQVLSKPNMMAKDIRYVLERESGPDHDKLFEVRLEVKGKHISSGEGKTKKKAEQDAAGKALKEGIENVL